MRTAGVAGAAPAWRLPFALPGSAALVIVGALRLLTLAPDLWEWDELGFVAAARGGVDVRLDHPHAPGYPLFVLPARLLVLVGAEPFSATLAIAVVAGLAAVALVGLLAGQLGAGRNEALWAAILWALVPAVWLHSVRPLSDSLGAATFFLAALLLLRCDDSPSGGRLTAAATAVGACAAVRPQVAVALLPLALGAAWGVFRGAGGTRRVALASGAGLATALAAYAPVVAGSGGIDGYLTAARRVSEWVRMNDTVPLSGLVSASLWSRWLVDPFGGLLPASLAWSAAAVGITLAPRASRRLAFVFGPLLLNSVATLSPQTAPRYALPTLAAAPIAAALGLTRLSHRHRLIASGSGAALLAVVAFPGAPVVVEVARRPSPPVAAMAVLRYDPALSARPLLLDPALRVHMADLGPRVPWREIEPGRPLESIVGAVWVTHDRDVPALRPLRVLRFVSPGLERISRGRYLSVTIWEARRAPDRSIPFKATDPEMPSSVDDPPEGATVPSPLRVRGWCRERGGGLVDPVEFRVDGVAIEPARLVRSDRPDVSAAIPSIGDASGAGFEATFSAMAVSPGEHVLEVVFESGERRRVYPPRRFRIVTVPR